MENYSPCEGEQVCWESSAKEVQTNGRAIAAGGVVFDGTVAESAVVMRPASSRN